MNEELPEGWARVPLDDLIEVGGIFDGPFGSSLKTSDYTESGVRVVRLENLANMRFVENKRTYISKAKYADLKRHTVNEGDVVFGSFVDGATRVCLLPRLDTPAIAKADCFTIRPNRELIDARFLVYQLGTNAARDSLTEEIHGATRPRINTKQLRAFETSLPPLPEQRRIVAKVEELLAQVNATRDRLAKVPAILKRFRQSVLAAACSGKLTDHWRSSAHANHTEKVLSAAVHRDDLPEVPSSWCWVPLPRLGELGRGKSKHRPRNDPKLHGGKYPFIQTGDVARSGGRITSHSQTYSDFGLAQSRLWPAGTVCITIAANIADSAMLTYPACFPDSVVGLRTEPDICLPNYAEYFVRTARHDLSQYAPGTAQKNINLEVLGEVVVPLPPLAEQYEVVRRVANLLDLADDAVTHVTRATTQSENLTQAILAKAFRGELVPTESELALAEGRNYETAEQLLARVRGAASDDTNTKQATKARRPRSDGTARASRRA